MKRFFVLGLLLSGISVQANAAPVPIQRIDVINMLWNVDATTPGLTPTSVLLKFSTSGSSTPCFTVTLPFEGSTTFFAGTGYACTTAVTTVLATPVANATTGSTPMYGAIASYTLATPNAYSSQLMIEQTPKGTGSSKGPTFNPANGTVATSGVAQITEQDAL